MRVWKSLEFTFDAEIHADVAAAREVARQPLESGLQAEVVEHAGPKSHRQVPYRPQHRLGQALGFSDRLDEQFPGRPAGALNSAQLHPQGGEHLADVVVQLAGELSALLFLVS